LTERVTECAAVLSERSTSNVQRYRVHDRPYGSDARGVHERVELDRFPDDTL
jgi:hypothetical protein